MAQFVELMRRAERMCKAHTDCEDCPVCMLIDDNCTCPFDGRLDAARIEKTVCDWAMANPEKPKVYPTWKDWLKQIGVIEPGEAPCDLSAVYRNILNDINGLNKRIPEEIARKLGIEPAGGGE